MPHQLQRRLLSCRLKEIFYIWNEINLLNSMTTKQFCNMSLKKCVTHTTMAGPSSLQSSDEFEGEVMWWSRFAGWELGLQFSPQVFVLCLSIPPWSLWPAFLTTELTKCPDVFTVCTYKAWGCCHQYSKLLASGSSVGPAWFLLDYQTICWVYWTPLTNPARTSWSKCLLVHWMSRGILVVLGVTW